MEDKDQLRVMLAGAVKNGLMGTKKLVNGDSCWFFTITDIKEDPKAK